MSRPATPRKLTRARRVLPAPPLTNIIGTGTLSVVLWHTTPEYLPPVSVLMRRRLFRWWEIRNGGSIEHFP